MGGADAQRQRWAVLVAAIWIQAFTGTNFDFSAYSSSLKSALGISQVQLNYLAVASDMGKALGWSSGLAILRLPLWAVLLFACAMGLVGYALQWLLLAGIVSLPYLAVFLLCLLAGCSICWFNTVCFALCVRSFPSSRALALSLTVSFNGVSAALYTIAARALAPSPHPSSYLLLNALLPLLASLLALPALLRPSAAPPPPSTTSDSRIFLALVALASATGLYLLLVTSASPSLATARLLLLSALLLLALPLIVPEVVSRSRWGRTGRADEGGDVDLLKGLLEDGGEWEVAEEEKGRGRMVAVGEEHGARRMIGTVEFWLYYVGYLCGATVGLVYNNNLGQIAQSLGREAETTMLVGVYSACSFFGRLLSSAPDLLNRQLHLARTGWLAIALIPMPLAYFLLAAAGDWYVLLTGTAIVGLSSGFIFAAAVSVTSELFGPNSIGLNHNILISNIPLGSLMYGLLAALIYDSNGYSSFMKVPLGDGATICMGRKCYATTFVAWGCITLMGLASSVVLFLRTRVAYARSERNRILTTMRKRSGVGQAVGDERWRDGRKGDLRR